MIVNQFLGKGEEQRGKDQYNSSRATTVVEGEIKQGKAWINVSADSSQKPVRIVYKAPFGHIVGTLKKIDLANNGEPARE